MEVELGFRGTQDSMVLTSFHLFIEQAFPPAWRHVLMLMSFAMFCVIDCRKERNGGITPTVEPSLTRPFVLLPGVLSLRTRTRNQAKTPTATRTLAASPTPTADEAPSACPPGTPEPLWVEPVTSPTDRLSQTIVVRIGYGEEVTVETESGTFIVTGNFNAYSNPARVDITLLPDTVHHLRVTARVATTKGSGGCPYGGYTLSTTRDAQGAPLTIVQASSHP